MLKIVSKKGVEKELQRILGRISFAQDHPEEGSVRKIIADVRKNGDKALIKYTKKFDKVTITSSTLKVKAAEIGDAYKKVKENYLEALRAAIKSITKFHEKQRVDQWFETMPKDVVMGLRSIPIEKVGIYVPGGTAAYPSSVLMNVIPAKLAGVSQLVMVTPPGPGKRVNPHILVAAKEVGIDAIYKVGGAQAIAALAFGTETIPSVDKIVGPGNIYVTLAKKLVFGVVGIDKIAGPSEILIIADESAEPKFIAADLLSQAEHDPESSAILVTDSEKIAKDTQKEIGKQLKKLSRKSVIKKSLAQNSAIFLVENLNESIDIANKIAPEHLELMVPSPQNFLEKLRNAGAVFLGPNSPEAVGDYIAGPNHVLPTGGTARFASPLGVYEFVKKQSIIGYTKPALEEVRSYIKTLAKVEGLDAHARSVDVRFE